MVGVPLKWWFIMVFNIFGGWIDTEKHLKKVPGDKNNGD